MDSLKTKETIPLLRLSFKLSSQHRRSNKGNRYAVVLGIDFKEEALVNNFSCREGARRVDKKELGGYRF